MRKAFLFFLVLFRFFSDDVDTENSYRKLNGTDKRRKNEKEQHKGAFKALIT